MKLNFHRGEIMDSVFERPLTIDEVKTVGAFYIEMRSSCFRIYRMDSVHIVRCVDDEAVHLICKYKPFFEIAEFDNYNIGWRAWLRLPTDEISSKHPWGEVKKCKGVGYGWEYNVDQMLSERCNDRNNARVIEIW